MTPYEAHCRERLKRWLELQAAATLKYPLDKPLRERVEATCARYLNHYNEEIQRLAREEAA